jgi:FixJ family two-component response regulator
MHEQEPTIFLVDDDFAVREALSGLLRAMGFVVSTFASAHEFLAASRRDAPGCLVLDLRMPGLSGIDLQQELVRAGTSVPIVFITAYGDVRTSVQAMKFGAVDFLSKPFTDQELLEAVRRALARDLAERQQRAALAALRERLKTLTARESEVMRLVVAGLLNKQIAAELGLSEITVKIHRARVMQKMGARSLPDLVRMTEHLDAGMARLPIDSFKV